jgi:hypothetical protein
MKIRIRTNLVTEKLYEWPNPPPPKPIRPTERFARTQKRLDNDPRAFKPAAQNAGL